MSHDWLDNPTALNNIKSLLVQMGLPLEIQVARIAQESDRWFQHLLGSASVGTGRILYGDEQGERALREIDYAVTAQIFPEIQASSETMLSIEANVLIECKHREGLAIFGFPYQIHEPRAPVNPIVSDLISTSLLRDVSKIATPLTNLPICAVGMLENMQRAPRIAGEQLIYKAAASLYDYIRFICTPWLATGVEPILEQLGIWNDFLEYAKDRLYYWEAALSWMRQHLSDDLVAAFNSAYFTEERGAARQDILVFIPIICVDAPLYLVDVGDDGTIEKITATPFLRTAVRLPEWPGQFHHLLLHPTPEALVTIVSVEHLPELLDRLAAWIGAINTYCESQPADVIDRSVLEMCFLSSVRSKLPEMTHSLAHWYIR